MNLRSKTIHFLPVEVADAPFILGLRSDERYNRYLSAVEPDVAKQEQWLAEYKRREALGQEFYYIIRRNADMMPIGTVRIYDFVKDAPSHTSGERSQSRRRNRPAAMPDGRQPLPRPAPGRQAAMVHALSAVSPIR
jgi:RimJ/RimL family protein N-acetyltransferase